MFRAPEIAFKGTSNTECSWIGCAKSRAQVKAHLVERNKEQQKVDEKEKER